MLIPTRLIMEILERVSARRADAERAVVPLISDHGRSDPFGREPRFLREELISFPFWLELDDPGTCPGLSHHPRRR